MKQIKKLFKQLKYHFYWKNRPVEYARMIGVNMPRGG